MNLAEARNASSSATIATMTRPGQAVAVIQRSPVNAGIVRRSPVAGSLAADGIFSPLPDRCSRLASSIERVGDARVERPAARVGVGRIEPDSGGTRVGMRRVAIEQVLDADCERRVAQARVL